MSGGEANLEEQDCHPIRYLVCDAEKMASQLEP